jgi:AmmeMemoRadiSam system protein B
MKHSIILFTVTLMILSCQIKKTEKIINKSRSMIDTVGFAHKAYQMDSIQTQITALFSDRMAQQKAAADISESTCWKVAISPHDDYAYTSYLYPLILDHIKAKTVIIFGVAHKAAVLGLKDRIIFDSFNAWNGPYGPVPVSTLRNELMAALPQDFYVVNDSMQTIEHSVEALLPFLKYNNREFEIISILIPYMAFERMKAISQLLAQSLYTAVDQREWEWGTDYALLISSDAVHYGNEEWGDKNFAYYGTDSVGYQKALDHEQQIIQNCLTGPLRMQKIQRFTTYTVQEDDYTEYKWTWCGRYSIPFGLLTGYYLQNLANLKLKGVLLDYATSIDHQHMSVKHLNMGTTAPAYERHWVGYVTIGYK